MLSEERKVVTVLFCDLVDFTAASDAADPEDVHARLRPYHARVREEIVGAVPALAETDALIERTTALAS